MDLKRGVLEGVVKEEEVEMLEMVVSGGGEGVRKVKRVYRVEEKVWLEESVWGGEYMIGIDSKGVLSGILRMTSTACLQGYVFVVVK